MLVNLVFSLNLPLSPSQQLDHLELFAGDMSVTKGEMQALGVAQICFFPTSGLEQFI